MSRQLGISAALSVIAMVGLALAAPAVERSAHSANGAGADHTVSTPAADRLLPNLPIFTPNS